MSLFSRAIGILIGVDEAANAVAGPETEDQIAGNPHYTLSERWGLACKNDPKRYAGSCRMCRILTWVERALGFVFRQKRWRLVSDHCRDALSGVPLDFPTDG